MSQFSIAGLQLALDNKNNLEVIAAAITKVKKRFPWIEMVVLPELASFGTDKKYAQTVPSELETFYQELAIQHELWIVTGSQYERDGDCIYNTAAVINSHGEIVTRFRKLFPFEPYETGVTSGNQIVTFDVPAGRIGLAICYDLWFPEVARGMACQGADILLYPTLTGTIDRPLEVTLAQATAICNQAYVFSVNVAGKLGNGQSIAVDPEGKVICHAGVDEEIIPLTIDFDLVKRTRENGILNLGQPLKSAREHAGKLTEQINYNSDYLESLDEIKMQHR